MYALGIDPRLEPGTKLRVAEKLFKVYAFAADWNSEHEVSVNSTFVPS